MLINSQTTVTDLLSFGAFIDGPYKSSFLDLISVNDDRNWIHDMSISKLIEKDATIHLANGFSITRKGCGVLLQNEFKNDTFLEFENSDIGFRHLSETLVNYKSTKIQVSLKNNIFVENVCFSWLFN